MDTWPKVIHHISSHTKDFSLQSNASEQQKCSEQNIQEQSLLANSEKRYMTYYYCTKCYFYRKSESDIADHIKKKHNKVFNVSDFVAEMKILRLKQEVDEESAEQISIEDKDDLSNQSVPSIKKKNCFTINNQIDQRIPNSSILTSNMARILALFKCMDNGCNFATNLPNEFTKHMESKPTPYTELECPYCRISFKMKPSKHLTDHIQDKHGLCRYQCNECYYRSSELSNVLVHRKLEHKTNEILVSHVIDCYNALADGMVEILECNKSLGRCIFCPVSDMKYSIDGLEQHIIDTHSSIERQILENKFYCLFCVYGSEKAYQIKQHMAVQHPSNELKAIQIEQLNVSNRGRFLSNENYQ